MMDAEDNGGFNPSELDIERLNTVEPNGRVTAENNFWVVLRYDALPHKGPNWMPWVVVSMPENYPGMYEMHRLNEVFLILKKLEARRRAVEKLD